MEKKKKEKEKEKERELKKLRREFKQVYERKQRKINQTLKACV